MDTTHRKIELQSLDDLSYLIANVQKAAQEVIDSHIPLPSTSFAGGGSSSEHVSRQTNRAKKDGSANEDHQMQRKEVEEIVNGYIDRTFTYALPNLSINGLDYASLPKSLRSSSQTMPGDDDDDDNPLASQKREKQDEEELYEPYDARLATRLQSLHSTLESETLALAELRRNAPLQAAEVIRLELEREAQNDHRHFVSTIPSTSKSTVTATAGTTGLRSTAKQDEEQQQKATMKDENEEEQEETKKGDIKMSNADDDVDVVDLELLRDVLPPGERRREMERNWGRALEELIQLKGTLPGTTAKLERAKAVMEYLESTHNNKS